ncbi:MAG TPA: EamA family transporter [Bacteroidia bacterium]|nr:EamA family transporter [Bacteroidia bacterium]
MKTKFRAIIFVLLCTIATSFGQIFFKIGSSTNFTKAISLLINLNFTDPLLNPLYILIFGLFLYGIGAILLILALKYGELSVVFPIFATNYIWVALLSSYFFAETINIFKIIGIAAIVSGIALIGIGSNHNINKKAKNKNKNSKKSAKSNKKVLQ